MRPVVPFLWHGDTVRIREELDIDEDRLAEICQRYGVAELSLFGSVLRDDFGPQSDVDVLYVFEPDAKIGWEIVDLQDELEALLGHPVDLVPKTRVHWLIRDDVLSSAEVVYAAA